MKPDYRLPRSKRSFWLLVCLIGLLITSGCSALDVRSQSPEDEIEAIASGVRLVGDLAVPFGNNPISIESVGLVTGLPGTGSDPAPSPQRAALLSEMQGRGVTNPNQLLASTATELVMVRGVLRPGIQKGDHFDVELRVPSRSECEGLRGGWLMQTRLKELALLGGSVHEGTTLGLAEGPVLVDPSAKDKVSKSRGRVLGGGVSLTSREVGLVLKDPNILVSSQIGTAVNRRFHTFSGGLKQGMAKPKTDEYIELKLHARYKDNIDRYIRVVRALPLHETPKQQQARVQLLERQLLDPITSATAAVRLEALGKDGIESLRKGMGASEEEVRFYSAEALAYLDQTEAAPLLGKLAHDVPAFRAYALAALSAMDDYAGYEALRDLLSATSAETRYGAFRSLWAMNSHDALVRGENLGDQFSYHVLQTQGPPMIHVTRSYRPELVLFGTDQRLRNPLSIEAGSEIMINTLDEDRVTVSRFSINEPDQKRVVSTKIDDVIRAIVELGGTYPDVVQALQAAKAAGALSSRFEVDALPKGGRTYYRKSAEEQPGEEETANEEGEIVVANPLPDLFSRRGYDEKDKAPKKKASDSDSSGDQKDDNADEKRQPIRSFLGKMVSRED
ncbi:MAG TPA: flagellar basal body P-ring protein FlgI [Pirellulales bacterium]|jgi:flagellar basal body P-ring protein FlgI|nr:flagellar basal body P-ring protein FlgI [Pirellulales bacterium]